MKTPFDAVNAIYTDQRPELFDSLTDKEQKLFGSYMVNRIISMNQNYLPIVNNFQQFYSEIGPRETYLFYSSILPKKKQFNKYVKTVEVKASPSLVIEMLVKYYNISITEAEYYFSILRQTGEGIVEVERILASYGTSPATIKKLNLTS